MAEEERFQRLKDLFEVGISLDRRGRARLLAKLRRAHDDIVDELEGLLAADDLQPTYLDESGVRELVPAATRRFFPELCGTDSEPPAPHI